MRERSICAAPVISSTVSPRTRSAIRKAPICAGVAAPAVIWSSAVRISSSVSVAPPETFWIRARNSCEGWASIVRLPGGVAEGAHVAAARAESGQLQADAGLVGRARARREHDALGRQLQDLGDADLVVAEDLAGGAELAQVVDEVIGEAVVVIDEDEHGPGLGEADARGQGGRPAG